MRPRKSMEVLWAIELFGGLRAVRDGRAIDRFRTHKTAALLAYLAYYHRRSHPRELLVDLFWPDSDVAAGRQSLSMALSSLRQQLEPPGVATGSVIVADRNNVGLNPLTVRVDTTSFEAALDRAASAPNDSEKVQCLIDALEIYTGELLPGFYDEWVVSEQQRLESLFVEAGAALVALLNARDELAASTGWAHRIAALAPLSAGTALSNPSQPSPGRSPLAGADTPKKGAFERTPGETTVNSSGAPPASAKDTPGSESGADTKPRFARGALPAGTVSFLLADLDRKTDAAARSRRLDEILTTIRPIIRNHSGWEIGVPNEPLLFAFGHASSAALAALQCRMALESPASIAEEAETRGETENRGEARSTDDAATPGGTEPSSEASRWTGVRIALDTGEAEFKGGRYQGAVLQSLARLLMAARGGQIICSETTASIVQRGQEPGVRLRDLGPYRLGSPHAGSAQDAPVRIYQVEDPGADPAELLRLNARPYYSGSIPLQFTQFFGRASELEKLSDLIRPARSVFPSAGFSPSGISPSASPGSTPSGGPGPEPPTPRLVTLTGPGGTGKTRLALEAAARFAGRFHEAAWFVPLAEIQDPSLAPSAILQALRLPHAPGIEVMDQVIESLMGMNGDPVLLVLDNFEQLLDEGAAMIQRLLREVPRLTCLVTSRRRLGLDYELEFPLAPLRTPSTAGTPEELSVFASVQLFVDRAQAVRPDFQITSANAAVIAELCRKLEGMPLSLELAASRAQVLSPTQILQQLSHRLDFLAARRSDRPQRHRTIRAAIDWSYHLLDPDLQQTFTRLAIFRGSWTLEAAEAICGTSSSGGATDSLASLEDCSLITVEDADGSVRFRMLETLWEYAEEHLGEEERQRLQAGHAGYYAAFAENTQPNLWGAEQADWFGIVEQEHENLRSALAWAADSDPTTALRLVAALGEFWEVRGFWSEGRSWAEKVLQNRGGERGIALERALCTAASLAALQGDFGPAAEFAEECLSLARENGHRSEEALALRKAAEIAVYRGYYEQARRLLEQSESINRDLDNPRGVVLCLLLLGRIASHHHEIARSRALWTESLELGRQIGEKRCVAMALDNLANHLLITSEFEMASRFHEESLAIRREIGDRAGVATSLSNLGWMNSAAGDLEKARSLWEESLGIRRDLGDKPGVAYSLLCLASLADRLEDIDGGALHEQSLGILRSVGYRWQISQALQSLAGHAYYHGDYDAAIRHLGESLAITRDLGMDAQQANVLRGLSINAHTQGDFAAALRFSEECVAIRRKLGDPGAVAQGLFHLGSDACGIEDFPYAAAALTEGMDLYLECSDLKGATYIIEAIARLENTIGNPDRASVLFGAAERFCDDLAVEPPLVRDHHEAQMSLLTSQLPDWQRFWQQGRSLDLAEVAALARESRIRAARAQEKKDRENISPSPGL